MLLPVPSCPPADDQLLSGCFEFDSVSGALTVNKPPAPSVTAHEPRRPVQGRDLVASLSALLADKNNTPESLAMTSMVTLLQQQQVLIQQQQMHLTQANAVLMARAGLLNSPVTFSHPCLDTSQAPLPSTALR